MTVATPAEAVGTASGDAAIAATIESMVASRASGATICPSEVARALVLDETGWRALMPRVRGVAAALAIAGRVVATRGGRIVDATSIGGPIRLGRGPATRAGGHDAASTEPTPKTRR